MAEEKTIQTLTQLFKSKGITAEFTAPRERRIFITVEREQLKTAILTVFRELDMWHLISTSAVDAGDHFEALYHTASENKTITFKVILSKEDPTLPTITDILPAAVLYEREFHDVMGFIIEGHPDMRPLILPENWGDKGYPLRKDWVDPRKKGGDA
ncbi:MAG: NADH-quinone oxidoreductase subunit C [Thermoplasmata archaeon]|nr:NADH-quinone oxidoreductase subunit C [Thermoplasmata archaeon]